jgi:flagellar hook assembly protein FlgD
MPTPNPFNPSTNIVFSLPQNMKNVEVEVFNLKGQKVKTLVNTNLSKGTYQFTWKGKDEKDNPVASGIYFFRLSSAGKQISIKKGMLLK